ncbi:MAG: UMP kinase [Candidatus Magasanikbacteria bacterium]
MYTIISLGGSLVIPPGGFNIKFLKDFRSLILNQIKHGKKFVIVVGGGSTCRQYQQAAFKVTDLNDEDLDWLGIYSTEFNAQFVRLLFKGYAHDVMVKNPTRKVKTNKSILIASGWKPGCSTDKDAVLLAKTYGAKSIINLSNISYVYDKDPSRYVSAKKIESIDWVRFRKEIVGNLWNPGKNAPFDPVASKLAQKLKLKVMMVKGTDLDEVKNVLTNKRFKGTVIG